MSHRASMTRSEREFLKQLAAVEGGQVRIRRLPYAGNGGTQVRQRCKKAGWAEFSTFGCAYWIITSKGREALEVEDA